MFLKFQDVLGFGGCGFVIDFKFYCILAADVVCMRAFLETPETCSAQL